MRVIAVGDNPALMWGLTARERLRRIAATHGLELADTAGEGSFIIVDLAYAFDPAWFRFIVKHPDHVVTRESRPFLAHCTSLEQIDPISDAMRANAPLPPLDDVTVFPQEDGELLNPDLRKRERAFAEQLTPQSAHALERTSYFASYKGVTDLLTKYLWPEWALVLTRLAARIGMTPNMVTAIGAALCVAATILFYHGWYWSGMAVGLGFMVLDTVDGKLARCTITSSWWGNIFDHGIDLIHPPFWWYAWGIGLATTEHPMNNDVLLAVMIAVVAGYILQRFIEGIFLRMFRMHIHVWRPFDSWFRLITARRNPNMVLLFLSLLIARPDLGLLALAAWTIISLGVHIVQLIQALHARSKGIAVTSWLEEAA